MSSINIEQLLEANEAFFNTQKGILAQFHHFHERDFVPIVYGEPTSREFFAKPSADLVATFRGPFPGIMKSKAVRFISLRTLENHNKKAVEISIEWFVLDDTLNDTPLGWLYRPRPEGVHRDDADGVPAQERRRTRSCSCATCSCVGP